MKTRDKLQVLQVRSFCKIVIKYAMITRQWIQNSSVLSSLIAQVSRINSLKIWKRKTSCWWIQTLSMNYLAT